MKKWFWLGQRFSDGFLFSRALESLDVFFCCNQPNGLEMLNLPIYALPPKNNFSRDFTYKPIDTIVNYYNKEMLKYLNNGYSIFPYYLSSKAKKKLDLKNSFFNNRIFRNQLSRILQMYLVSKLGVNTPKWIIPHNISYNELISKFGKRFIFQFDKTSSGEGTFLINSKKDYDSFLSKYGEADIALQYLENSLSCSINLYITNNDILLTSPSVQIIEQKTGEKISNFQFLGNDFNYYNRKNIGNYSIIESIYRIGEMYQKIGIWGLLGIDFLLKDGVFFYNETNFRLQNSASLLSFLQPRFSGNIIDCIIYNNDKLYNVERGYQFFTKANVPGMKSGYYNYDGKYCSNITSTDFYGDKNSVLIFCSNQGINTKKLRIIGFDRYFDNESNVSGLIERLENSYGNSSRNTNKFDVV